MYSVPISFWEKLCESFDFWMHVIEFAPKSISWKWKLFTLKPTDTFGQLTNKHTVPLKLYNKQVYIIKGRSWTSVATCVCLCVRRTKVKIEWKLLYKNAIIIKIILKTIQNNREIKYFVKAKIKSMKQTNFLEVSELQVTYEVKKEHCVCILSFSNSSCGVYTWPYCTEIRLM